MQTKAIFCQVWIISSQKVNVMAQLDQLVNGKKIIYLVLSYIFNVTNGDKTIKTEKTLKQMQSACLKQENKVPLTTLNTVVKP